MKTPLSKTARGFSLVELLAALAIVATLIAAATPLYHKHAQQLRLLDGQTKLLEAMDLEHRYYAYSFTYTDNFELLGLHTENGEVVSDRTHYRLSAAACKNDLGACVRLTATPRRNSDTTLTLDSRGRRTPPDTWR